MTNQTIKTDIDGLLETIQAMPKETAGMLAKACQERVAACVAEEQKKAREAIAARQKALDDQIKAMKAKVEEENRKELEKSGLALVPKRGRPKKKRAKKLT